MDEEKKKLHQIVGYVEEKCEAIEKNIRGSYKNDRSPDRNSFGRNYIPGGINSLHEMGIEVGAKPFREMNNQANGRASNFRQHLQDADDDETLFHSINCEYDIFDEVSKSFIQNPISKKNTDSEPLLKKGKGGYENVLGSIDIKKKHRLFERNEELLKSDAYQKFPIDKDNNEDTRDILPCKKDPSQTLNIWELLKDCIGKDLTRIALPVY